MRLDTAVVGAILENDVFFACTLIANNDGGKDIALACTDSKDCVDNIKTLYFVQSSTYLMMNNWNNSNYLPVVFQGIREPSGTFMFIALNDLNSAGGILGNIVSNNNILSIDTTNSSFSNLILDPSPYSSEYPTNLLLSALPYNIFTPDSSQVKIKQVSSTGNDKGPILGGLATGTSRPKSVTSPIILLPISYFYSTNNNCSSTSLPTNIVGSFPSIQYNQCVLLPGTNYSNNQMCKSLQKGFTKKYECMQGGTLYAYCQNKAVGSTGNYCGNKSTYYNLLTGQEEKTDSCKGWCQEGWCVSNNKNSNNTCTSSIATLTNSESETNTPWWSWVIIVFLFGIILVLIALFIWKLYVDSDYYKENHGDLFDFMQ